MKHNTYRYGKYTLKTQIRPVGLGWETSFRFDGFDVFVGNFIHREEATRWYTLMNRQIVKFSKQYPIGKGFPTPWFKNFMSNYLYKNYYTFLDKIFVRHNRDFSKAFTQDLRRYKGLKHHAGKFEAPRLIKRAA